MKKSNPLEELADFEVHMINAMCTKVHPEGMNNLKGQFAAFELFEHRPDRYRDIFYSMHQDETCLFIQENGLPIDLQGNITRTAQRVRGVLVQGDPEYYSLKKKLLRALKLTA